MRWRCVCAFVLLLSAAFRLEAATIYVAAGGNLQDALNAARPGDTVLLAENAEFVGNFVLPAKVGDQWITVRSSAPDSLLPRAGYRIKPQDAPLLARLRSPNSDPALRTAPGAHHWDIRYLDFPSTQGGLGEILQVGDGSSAQNSLSLVPHHIVLNHVYIHGDPYVGQKRGIALNAAHVTISDSYIAECKGIGQDTQAIGGWNGPGPYTIENNYLEAAGENLMIGGADPAIPNLVADGITVRRNYFSRPMAWRNPIVAAPSGLSATAVSGGSLPPGSYGYRVVARRTVQSTVAKSAASAEVSVTTAADGAVRVRWQAVPGTTEYWVYGRTPGAQNAFWVVTGTELVDTGAAGTAGTVPTSAATVWSVKNIFELKNARNVVVEDNILENHWKESQPGYAIVFTPRNSQGACTWCVVEHVRFERNLVRNAAAGINILGYDNGNPSRQAADITIRQNLFNLSTSLGGNGWFLLIGDGPRDVVVEHNTIDSNGNALIYVYGGSSTDPREIYGFRMTGNASRHGSYGINGQYFGYGNGILSGFFPGFVFDRNYLAGASASRYPAGTLVANYFQDQFVNSAAGDYTVRDSSILKRAAPDGSDVGADYPALVTAIDGVVEGRPPQGGNNIPVPPYASFTSSCTVLSCSFTDTSIPGTAPLASRAWSFGDGSAIGTSSPAAHTYAAAGSYTVTLTVTDAEGQSSSANRTVSVTAPNTAPTAAFTVSCVGLTCAFTDRSTDADGTIAAWSWAFGAGSAYVAAPSFTFAASGTYQVTLTVADDDGATSSVTNAVVVTGGLHVAYSGTTNKWFSSTGLNTYWSADVTITLHAPDERPIAGATVTAAWTGAVAKTVTCVTNTAGSCLLKSGTLSYSRSWVTLDVTSVVSASGVYERAGNHTQSGTPAPSLTLNRP
jgi:PKD repeat protein